MVYSVKSSLDMEKKLRGADNKVVVLDFYAKWCGPCQTMEPILHELEHKYGDRLLIMKVNVDIFAAIADDYKVASLPTFILFKNGQQIRGKILGADDTKLKQKLSKLL